MLVIPNPDEEKISEIRSKLDDAISFRDFLKTENDNLRAVFETIGGIITTENDELSKYCDTCRRNANINKQTSYR